MWCQPAALVLAVKPVASCTWKFQASPKLSLSELSLCYGVLFIYHEELQVCFTEFSFALLVIIPSFSFSWEVKPIKIVDFCNFYPLYFLVAGLNFSKFFTTKLYNWGNCEPDVCRCSATHGANCKHQPVMVSTFSDHRGCCLSLERTWLLCSSRCSSASFGYTYKRAYCSQSKKSEGETFK